MDLIGTIISAIVSATVGVCLWLFLPRGVVLTRQRIPDIEDAWTIRNNSAVSILILSVSVVGVATYDSQKQCFDEIDLGPAGESKLGVSLTHDDECEEIRMYSWNKSWEGETISPGDTLTAEVGNNCSLVIGYRRAGRSGIFERRTITIHGGV